LIFFLQIIISGCTALVVVGQRSNVIEARRVLFLHLPRLTSLICKALVHVSLYGCPLLVDGPIASHAVELCKDNITPTTQWLKKSMSLALPTVLALIMAARRLRRRHLPDELWKECILQEFLDIVPEFYP
jgi:hypothetical protein